MNDSDLRFIEGTPEHDYAVEQAKKDEIGKLHALQLVLENSNDLYRPTVAVLKDAAVAVKELREIKTKEME